MGWFDNWFNTGWFGASSSVNVAIGAETVAALSANPSPTLITGVMVSPGALAINSLIWGVSISQGLAIQSGAIGKSLLLSVPSVAAGSFVTVGFLGEALLLNPPSIVVGTATTSGTLGNNLSLYNPIVATDALVAPIPLDSALAPLDVSILGRGWFNSWFIDEWFGTVSGFDVTTTPVVMATRSLPIEPAVVTDTQVALGNQVINFATMAITLSQETNIKPEFLGNRLSSDTPSVTASALIMPGMLATTMAGEEPVFNLNASLSLAALNIKFNVLSPEGSGSGQVILEPVFVNIMMAPIIFQAGVKLDTDPLVYHFSQPMRNIDIIVDI